MNVFVFSGNLGADAELKSIQSGEKVCSFRVASKSGYGDRAKTDWVDCVLWGKRGESVAQYLKKGMKVTVSGELRLEEFKRKDGTPGAKLSVRVNEVDLPARDHEGHQQSGGYSSGTPNRGYGGGSQGQGYSEPKGGAGGRGGGKPKFDDDDLSDEIPFLSW